MSYRDCPNFIVKAAHRAKGAGQAKIIIDYWLKYGCVPVEHEHLVAEEAFKAAKNNSTGFGGKGVAAQGA